ncbi:MAG: HAMP domain-containing histidine kinase [Sphingomonadales bacterium]|nr:HAMP domain-containing histidine kinase [Sphingomonadales bacterium]
MLNNSLMAERMENDFIVPEIGLFDALEAVNEVADSMREICKKDQDININYSGIKEIKTDKKILQKIMLNLISNAIKYSDSNIYGIIKNSRKKPIISVKDSGIGVPENVQKHLFSRFFRASNATHLKGIGLGLTTISFYIKALKGSIHHISKENMGSIFEVFIPNNFKNL